MTDSVVRHVRLGWIAITLTLIAVAMVSTAARYGVLGPLAAPLESERSSLSNGQARGEMAASQPNDNTTAGAGVSDVLSSGRYGGFEVTVIGARPIPENTSGRPIIVVEIEVGNMLDFRLRLPQSMVSLIDESDRVVPIHRFEHTEHLTGLTIRPGERQRATLVVRLNPGMSAELDRYQLHIAEPGRWPLELPLVGASPGDSGDGAAPDRPADPTHDVLVTHHQSADTTRKGEASSRLITSISAEVTLNHRGYRAGRDHHLLVATIEVSPVTAADLDKLTKTRWWRLKSSETVLPPLDVHVLNRTASAARLQVIFEPPMSATILSLRAGAEGPINSDLADLTVPTKGVSQEAEPETA